MTTPLDSLANWLASYDPQALRNEADVEDHCVVPLFQFLGYPDQHRHRQVAVNIRAPGQRGRKPAADLVYYADAEPDRQTSDTALVLVEAKEPGTKDLNEALMQAHSYTADIKPLLLVVTNGKRLVVLRRRYFRDDDLIFDQPVSDFTNPALLQQLYELLNFATVCQQREQLADELRHAQYVELERTLRSYPDIQELLAQGDFKVSTFSYKPFVSITRPKVALTGELKSGFGQPSCEIRFSNLLRSGLTIYLNHRDLLGDCMLGIGDPPNWNTRRFIRSETDDSFLAHIGQTTMFLSTAEAEDLCECLDYFCNLYRDTIIESEDRLETWEYPITSTHTGNGFYLLSVPSNFWELVRDFSNRFHYSEGKSDWHIFDSDPSALRVIRPADGLDRTLVYSELELGFEDKNHTVKLIYTFPDYILCSIAEKTQEPWQEAFKKKSVWDARKTHLWLVKSLLLSVLMYYERILGRSSGDLKHLINSLPHPETFIPTPRRAEVAAALSPYLNEIQVWLASYKTSRMNTRLLYPCFAACLALAQRADPNQVNLHYAASKIGGVEQVGQMEYDQFQHGKNPARARQVFTQIIEKLGTRVESLQQSNTVDPSKVDLMMRSMITILKEGKIDCGQVELRAAQDAVEALWQEARFHRRHVWPMAQRS